LRKECARDGGRAIDDVVGEGLEGSGTPWTGGGGGIWLLSAGFRVRGADCACAVGAVALTVNAAAVSSGSGDGDRDDVGVGKLRTSG